MSWQGKSAVLSLLSAYVPYRPEFAALVDNSGRAIGEDAALFLSDIFHWSDKGSDPDGWIYKSASEMEQETGLTRRKQTAARDKLASIGLLEQSRRGERGIMHYRIDMDTLICLLAPHPPTPAVQFAQNGQSENQSVQNVQTAPADVTKTPNRNVQNVQAAPAIQFSQNVKSLNNIAEKQRHKNGQSPPAPPPSHPVFEIPPALDTEPFKSAWVEWYKHLLEINRPLTQTTGDKQLKRLAEWGCQRAIQAIEHSIEHGWKAIYEPKPEAGGNGQVAPAANEPKGFAAIRRALGGAV